jgi:hypothetical protein
MKAPYLGTKEQLFGFSASTQGIFLELHASQFPCMRYERGKFGCDRLNQVSDVHRAPHERAEPARYLDSWWVEAPM